MQGVVVIIAFLVLLALAIVMLTIGVRGRWQRCEPRCARCSQRVGLHEVEASGRCPECGHALADPGGVRWFERRRRPLFLVLGSALVLLAVAIPFVLALLVRATTMGGPVTMATQPTSALIAAMGNERSVFELQELEARARAGTLTPAELRAIVTIMKTVSDARDQRRIFPSAKEIIIRARATGAITDDDARSLLDAWYPADTLVQLPPIVRTGGTLTLRGDIFDQSPPIVVEARVGSAALGGKALDMQRFSQPSDAAIDLRFGGMITIEAPPGQHEVRLELQRTMRFAPGTAPNPAIPGDTGTPDGAPKIQDVRTVVIPIEVISEDAPSFVRMESPSARAAEVRRSCSVTAAAIDRDSKGGGCIVRVDAQIPGVEGLHLAFDLIAVIEGQEIALGWTSARVSEDGSSRSMTSSISVGRLASCPDPIPDVISVILRPAPRRVEEEVDTGAIWGEEIEIRNVPVRSNMRSQGPRP